MNWLKFQQYVKDRVAKPDTEEAQERINDGRSHIAEVWEDGEVTVSKAGDLYRHRRLHQSLSPRLPEGYKLWHPEGDHERRIVMDEDLPQMLEEATFEWRGEGHFEVTLPDGGDL